MLRTIQALIGSLQGSPDGLVKKARTGDAEAFGKLYIQYLDRIYRFTLFRVNNKDDAEDIVEIIFYKAWEKIRSFQGNDIQFKSWLFMIARNTIIDYYRSRRKQVELSDELADTGKLPEEEVTLSFFKDDLYQALTTLTAEQREFIILKFIEGLSNKEISLILKKGEDALRALQYRALRQLKNQLTIYGK